MLDQLKSALETFATATQQTQDTFMHHQAEAKNNLARFQEAQNEVAGSIKEDWAKMSEELTQYTWTSYLSMFSDVARHYSNLTDFFTRSSEVAIANQDEALSKAHRVHDALDNSIATAHDLANHQTALHDLISTNNAAILTSQAQMQARSEFLLSLMDIIELTLAEEVDKLGIVVNSTNELRGLLHESSPLITLLTPLTDGLRLVASLVRAVVHVDLLGVITVGVNGGLVWVSGRRFLMTREVSLVGWLSVLVAMRKCLLHFMCLC